MEYGCDTRAELVIITCTRNTETRPLMVLLNKCILRWHLATGWGFHASKSSRQLPSQLSFARGRVPSSSTTPKSNSHWCSRRLDHHPGSSRQHSRHRGPTCLCDLSLLGYIDCWSRANLMLDFLFEFIALDCICSIFQAFKITWFVKLFMSSYFHGESVLVWCHGESFGEPYFGFSMELLGKWCLQNSRKLVLVVNSNDYRAQWLVAGCRPAAF